MWLNEGFASFMENYCTNELFPEFNIWPQFVTDTMIPAFQVHILGFGADFSDAEFPTIGNNNFDIGVIHK